MSEHDNLPHLRIERAARETKRRPGGNPQPERPANLSEHARALRNSVTAIQRQPAPATGFDKRRLLTLEVQLGDPADLERQIPGLTVVAQEDKTLNVLFATREGLETFRHRCEQLETNGKAKYGPVIFSVYEGFGLKMGSAKGDRHAHRNHREIHHGSGSEGGHRTVRHQRPGEADNQAACGDRPRGRDRAAPRLPQGRTRTRAPRPTPATGRAPSA